MFVIRKGYFETNSSEVHAIVLENDSSYTINKSLIITNIEGVCKTWDDDYDEDTLNYAYQLSRRCHKEEDFINWLGSLGVDEIKIKGGKTYTFNDENRPENISNPLAIYIKDVNHLKEFIFSNDSFVITGNDNEGDVDDRIYEYEDKSQYTVIHLDA